LDPRRAVDEDGAPVHPRKTAAVRRPELTTGVAADADKPAGHLRASPVRRVARYFDRPALHVGTEVHPGVSHEVDLATGHPAADPLDARRVPVNLQRFASCSFDLEEIVQSEPTLAQDDG